MRGVWRGFSSGAVVEFCKGWREGVERVGSSRKEARLEVSSTRKVVNRLLLWENGSVYKAEEALVAGAKLGLGLAHPCFVVVNVTAGEGRCPPQRLSPSVLRP